MACKFCNLKITSLDHDVSPEHIKNKVFYEYTQNRKKYSGNRHGMVVSCDITASKCVDSTNNVRPKIDASTKPNEQVKFSFKVLNETNSEDFLVVGVQLVHPHLHFTMNDHGLVLGEDPYILHPKNAVPRDIHITFRSENIGLYNMHILFFFQKVKTNESLIIIREMTVENVYVETSPAEHNKIISPYAQKEVKADTLLRCTVAVRRSTTFTIPKQYKTIFARALQLPEDASDQDRAVAETIIESFNIGVKEDNYVEFFHNLLWYEETIVRMNLKKYNMLKVPLCRQGEVYLLNVPGLAEKRPSLMLGDTVFVKPHGNDEVMFEGAIVKIESNVAHLGGLNHAFLQHYRPDARFDVRFFMSRVPLERMHAAVTALAQARQLPRVFPAENPRVPPVTSIVEFFNPLIATNVEQRQAVEHIVAGTSGTAPYLLHGPPGTGKTITIVEAILQLVKKSPDNRILVCTDSNMAADHVASVLVQYRDRFPGTKNFLLRANSKFRVWECMPEALEPYSNGLSFVSYRNVTPGMLAGYSIVVATLSHTAKFATKDTRPITHLFIDEAAQASEPACLVPVAGLLQARGQLVLAGDPLQLGPVVISHDAARKGLGISLMERLRDQNPLYLARRGDPAYTVMLRNNFRSHRDILDLPNRLFYEGNLLAYAAEDPLSSIDILTGAPGSRAIVFHGCCSKEQRIGKSPSYFNEMELGLVKQYITALTERRGVRPEDIGVVTPYLRQVHKVKEWLTAAGYANRVEVGTVESFQGKEKRVMVASTVRARAALLDHDAKFKIGFLSDDKRFNVALTRAKAKAIIIGNPLCLEKDEKWREYINMCRSFGTHLGFDTRLERSDQVVEQLKQNVRAFNELMITN
ncbi:RNA helicase Mov10l1 isoform X1 [Plutella xylostella]|uniref:RNA helicase Mov10l1 isoform X1 n=1 Tax=Plutella xylostella TaxID=51655 RepID=UPI002032D7CB|nr:RNA helicase Mov10l1 isoform X1 [Plutella xylostella]